MFSRRLCAPVVVVVVLFGAVSCTSTSESSACNDLQALSTEVEELFSLNPIAVGADGVKAQIDEVQDRWQIAQRSARDQFAGELDTFEDAVQALIETSRAVAAGELPVGEGMSTIGDEITGVRSTWDELTSEASTKLSDCDLAQT